jgi:NTP pyrophosphatase (non-canonical NTP hydrolase)
MSDAQETIGQLRQLVDQFVAERDWQQFHTPKNLAMALAIEAAELMEHFQWLDAREATEIAQDDVRRSQVAEELADVICYALAMANALGIEVGQAVRQKMLKNAQKYPREQYRGRWGDGDKRRP